MNQLVFIPTSDALEFSVFGDRSREPMRTGRLAPFGRLETTLGQMDEQLTDIQPDLVAIRCIYGGGEFEGPALLSDETREKLGRIVHLSPLHLPPMMEFLTHCETLFPGVPIVLVFETSFFHALPLYERRYGLDERETASFVPDRLGYHGLFHGAACGSLFVDAASTATDALPRIISICLQRRPEVAAVSGYRPVMVTSGATPLDGLPGQTTCGELDPSIVLTLAEEYDWGPEQIAQVLTEQRSGLLGLTGRPTTLGSLWSAKVETDEDRLARELTEPADESNQLARGLMEYRLLQACGSAIAALGGVDAIVFSGRFAACGRWIGPSLVEHLRRLPGLADSPPSWSCFPDRLDRIVADAALAAVCLTR